MAKKLFKDSEAPVYEIMIGDDDNTGIRFVSLVEDPAIDVQGMFFSKKELHNYEFNNLPDRQMVVGPALIPNKKIARKDDDGDLYFVFFSEETIRQMVSKFNKFNNNKSINIDHSNQMLDAYILSNWIVEDSYYDKSKLYGFDLPKGSWFIEIKIDDEEQWNTYVKEGGRYSFSVEGLMGQTPSKYSSLEHLFSFIDELSENELNEILNDTFEKKKFHLTLTKQ